MFLHWLSEFTSDMVVIGLSGLGIFLAVVCLVFVGMFIADNVRRIR